MYLAVDALNHALSFITHIYNDALASIDDLITGLESIANYVLSWVNNAFVTVSGWINGAWDWFYANVVAPVIQDVRNVVTWSVGVLSSALDDLKNVATWWWDNVVTPVWDWVQHAAETVGGWVYSALLTFYRDFVQPIEHGLSDVAHGVETALAWLAHYGAIIASIIDRLGVNALEWLIDPRGQLAKLEQDVEGMQWLTWAENETVGLVSDAESWADDLVSFFR